MSIKLVGDGENGVGLSGVVSDFDGSVVDIELSSGRELALKKIIASREDKLVSVDGLSGGHTNGLQVILSVSIGVELNAILLACPVEVGRGDVICELVVDIDGGSSVKSSGNRLLGKE